MTNYVDENLISFHADNDSDRELLHQMATLFSCGLLKVVITAAFKVIQNIPGGWSPPTCMKGK